jgi:hypothetical protein
LRDWHDKYEQAGLTVVGVHSPEFPWEKPLTKVKEATARLAIKFPVVQDNGFDVWKRLADDRSGRQKGRDPLQPCRRGRLPENRIDHQTTACGNKLTRDLLLATMRS